MDMDKKICKCKKVTYGDVLAAMEKGATSFKEVKRRPVPVPSAVTARRR